MLVGVEAIGDAAKSAESLQSVDDARLDRIVRALDFGGVRSGCPELLELGVDGGLELLRRLAGACYDFDREHRSQRQRVLLDLNALRNLLVVDQRFEQAAGAAATENVRGNGGIGITVLENRRRQPAHAHLRELDGVGDREAALARDRRRLDIRLLHRGPTLQRSEVLLDQRLDLRGVDVADDREAGIVRRVVLLEEVPHVLELRGLNVLVGSDDARVVRVTFGNSAWMPASSTMPYG